MIGPAGIMSGEFGIGEGKTSSKGLPPHVWRPLRASADRSGGYTGIFKFMRVDGGAKLFQKVARKYCRFWMGIVGGIA